MKSNLKRSGAAAAALFASTLVLAGCSNADNNSGDSNGGESNYDMADVSGTLNGEGASSQQNAMENVFGPAFSESGSTLAYNATGSGAGQEQFLANQVDFAGSDSPLKDEQVETAAKRCGGNEAWHLPMVIGPVAVAYNLNGVDTLNLNTETIAKIFKGEIKKWNDDAIASQNEGVELPDTDITVVHRSDKSGTTKNFVSYLSEAAPEAWTYEVAEEWPSDITAESAQGTKGVVGQASSTEGAITYADASAVGTLGTVDVKVGDEYVKQSPEAAAKLVETSEEKEDGSLEIDPTTTEQGVYPVVLVSYHIYCNQYDSQETVDQVKAFGEYVISEDGQKAAQEAAGNAPITAATRDAAMKRIEAISVQG